MVTSIIPRTINNQLLKSLCPDPDSLEYDAISRPTILPPCSVMHTSYFGSPLKANKICWIGMSGDFPYLNCLICSLCGVGINT